jgi:hypothetical protein
VGLDRTDLVEGQKAPDPVLLRLVAHVVQGLLGSAPGDAAADEHLQDGLAVA